MRGQAGWAPRALQSTNWLTDQGLRPSRPRGTRPGFGVVPWSPGTMSAGKAAVSEELGSSGTPELVPVSSQQPGVKSCCQPLKTQPSLGLSVVTGGRWVRPAGGDGSAWCCCLSLSLAGWGAQLPAATTQGTEHASEQPRWQG